MYKGKPLKTIHDYNGLNQIISHLVSRKKKYIRVLIEGIICAISMMNIKINYKDTLQAMYMLGIASSYGHISENTEPHRALRNGMMSWWSYQSKTYGLLLA